VVDDSPLICRIFSDRLKAHGVNVVCHDNGLDAIKSAFRLRPDGIVLDINMPKVNGYQVCRLLKDHRATKHIPILIVSAEDTRRGPILNPQNWSFEIGADAYHEKSLGFDVYPVMNQLMNTSKQPPSKEEQSVTEPSEMDILIALSKLLDEQLYKDVTRLKELSKRKDAFVANVSHEFKSPLSILHAYFETILEGAMGELPVTIANAIRRCDRISLRLNRLVSDLLDLAKIEAGKLTIKQVPVDVKVIFNEMEKDFEPILAEAAITVCQDFAADSSWVVGDHDRLLQVCFNLFSNCLKYSPRGGKIYLRVKPTENSVTAEIEDEGPGMSPENLTKIFDKFERIHEEKREGTGLGLPIAKEIVELHHGKIWAESALGKGTKFCIMLKRINPN
jgi:signal transduction histidine kinase